MTRAKRYAATGVLMGTFGTCYAVYSDLSFVAAICGVLWGWTIVIAILSWRMAR